MTKAARNPGVLSGLAIAALMVAAGPALCSSGSDSFMEPQGPIAAIQRTHLIRATILILVAVIPVLVLVPLILFRYRRRNRSANYRPDWDFALPLEILMWGVPVAIVAVLSFYLWKATHRLDPYANNFGEGPPVRVQVVGLDWKWLFIYPDLGIASVGEFGMPLKQPVAMTLTTDTVMQSFIIPALAGQIYAMPGMTTELHLVADTPGRMQGENTQYNGRGFTGQKFAALAMTQDEFDAWIEQVRATGIPLDAETYGTLAERTDRAEVQAALGTPGMPENALYFTLPDARLFHSIVARYHSGEALAVEDQPGTAAFSDRSGTELGAGQ